MIFIDSNVPMYLIGTEHPLKARSHQVIENLARTRRRMVTDAEVLQEICHRYQAIKRTDLIQSAFDVLLGIIDDVFPITKQDVIRSKDLLLNYAGFSARDALHAAVMETLGIKEIFSYDTDFERLPWLSRIS